MAHISSETPLSQQITSGEKPPSLNKILSSPENVNENIYKLQEIIREGIECAPSLSRGHLGIDITRGKGFAHGSAFDGVYCGATIQTDYPQDIINKAFESLDKKPLLMKFTSGKEEKDWKRYEYLIPKADRYLKLKIQTFEGTKNPTWTGAFRIETFIVAHPTPEMVIERDKIFYEEKIERLRIAKLSNLIYPQLSKFTSEEKTLIECDLKLFGVDWLTKKQIEKAVVETGLFKIQRKKPGTRRSTKETVFQILDDEGGKPMKDVYLISSLTRDKDGRKLAFKLRDNRKVIPVDVLISREESQELLKNISKKDWKLISERIESYKKINNSRSRVIFSVNDFQLTKGFQAFLNKCARKKIFQVNPLGVTKLSVNQQSISINKFTDLVTEKRKAVTTVNIDDSEWKLTAKRFITKQKSKNGNGSSTSSDTTTFYFQRFNEATQTEKCLEKIF